MVPLRSRGARSGKASGAEAKAESREIAELRRAVGALSSRLESAEAAQEEQLLLIMKFGIVRSIGIMSLLVEQSSAPARVLEEAQETISEVTKKIVAAASLDEVRELDVRLQDQLRGLVRTFRRT